MRSAIQSAPGYAPPYAELAMLLCGQDRSAEALALIEQAIETQPGKAWPLSIKAAVLTVERRVEETIVLHEQAVARAPEQPLLWVNFAHALHALGRTEQAAVAYRRALRLDPANGAAWLGLADLRTIRFTAGDIDQLRRAITRSSDALGQVKLHFALGRALADQGAFELSFRSYEQANRLRSCLVPYDPLAVTRLIDRLGSNFNSRFFAERREQGCDTPGPIFIVGMPRSGSTLVEQILASHPMVEGLGELFELGNIAARLGGGEDEASWVAPAASLDAPDRADLGARYLASIRRYRRSGRPFFTDKMPANWQRIALVALILPSARIIDVRRDPVACCFSSFTTYFNRNTRTPTDLNGWGAYYREYVRALDLYEGLLPGKVHRLQYERLVDDPEDEVRRLLAYLQLPFDEACLRFHETDRPVDTPSAQQVRRPINRDGLARWRNYERWLDPLMGN